MILLLCCNFKSLNDRLNAEAEQPWHTKSRKSYPRAQWRTACFHHLHHFTLHLVAYFLWQVAFFLWHIYVFYIFSLWQWECGVFIPEYDNEVSNFTVIVCVLLFVPSFLQHPAVFPLFQREGSPDTSLVLLEAFSPLKGLFPCFCFLLLPPWGQNLSICKASGDNLDCLSK